MAEGRRGARPATADPPADAVVLPSLEQVFPGESEMAARMRAYDWSQTPLGPVEEWPRSLKTAVGICLGSRYPIVIWWGKQALTQFYNDAYISFLGVAKHPGALGRSGRESWSEIWQIIDPMLEGVFATGVATWSEDFLYVLNRNLPREEAYFTFSYSPLWDDGGVIDGIFCACSETTGRVLSERRLRTLRDLGRTVMEAKSAEEACAVAARALAANPADIPFALFYLADDEARHARLVATTRLEVGSAAAPDWIDLSDPAGTSATWPLPRVFHTAAAELVSDLATRFGPLPGGLWPESSHAAVVLPITAPAKARPTGFLVAGLSPRHVVDAGYRGFFDLIAGHVAASIGNARAHEEERRRAEALAELDRAKTTFFSNVSHEFRTPLTLLLAPLEDLLAGAVGTLAPRQREELLVAHRNGLRLLKLVNTLLDFSRLEAGRVQACYEATDLPAFTADLASQFRAAAERAGLRLAVHCPPLPAGVKVYVDRAMWEKIVLNLLSNSLKHTFEGEIDVSLRPGGDGRSVVLTVRDTGTGIAAEDLPHLFERFYRIQGALARTQEGTGIGLALVQELTNLHGGWVGVESVLGAGTAFTVTIPTGYAHLPVDRVATVGEARSPALAAAAFVEEALRWLPGGAGGPGSRGDGEQGSAGDGLIGDSTDATSPGGFPSARTQASSSPLLPGPSAPRPPSPPAPRVLMADDNADMRAYLERLLGRRYAVEAVADGAAALAVARAGPPDLVLADVMMPGLDGFALLRALRADERTRGIPVILLSARAGEEATVEGVAAGADDYLVKPFAARELLARVGTHLELARVRAEGAEREHAARLQAEALAAENALLYREAREQADVHMRLSAALRQLADERAAILDREQAARAEAEAAVRTRDDVIASVAHDLKNPLTAIKGTIQLLRRQAARADAVPADRIEGLLATVDESVAEMVGQLDDLLDAARLQAGEQLRLERQPVDLVALARQLALDYRDRSDAHYIAVHAGEPQLVGEWDPRRLKRVLDNVLGNAIKYSPGGGNVHLTITHQPGAAGEQATIAVSDEGVGIPAADLPMVFERFRRGTNVTGRVTGTGLGLHSARHIVERHGGSMAIESQEGEGTTVTICLPLTPAAGRPAGEHGSA